MQPLTSKLRDWLVTGGRRRGPRCRLAGTALLLLSLAGQLGAATPTSEGPTPTGDALSAEALTRLSNLVQNAESGQAEDMASADDLSQTNGPSTGADRVAEPGRLDKSGRASGSNSLQSSSRSTSDDRRARGRRSIRSRTDRSGGSGGVNDASKGTDRNQAGDQATTNNGPATLDYAAFRVVVDRNIFDPNRYPRGPGAKGPATKPKVVSSLKLVGTMAYEKGMFAFFDGSSSDYQKAVKVTEAIAGYKVTSIAPNGVRLASGTNELELSVGSHLRREEDGPWQLTNQPEVASASSASSTSGGTSTASAGGASALGSGADSDVLKRLMERRAKE
jgi:hypothetical protein